MPEVALKTRSQLMSLVQSDVADPARWPIDAPELANLLIQMLQSAFMKVEDTISQGNVAGLIQRLARLESSAGGAASETAGLKIFEELQDDPGVLLIEQTTNLLYGPQGLRYEALQDIPRVGGVFTPPTGEDNDPLWKNVPIGGIGYNPRITINQSAFPGMEGSWKPDKLYELVRVRTILSEDAPPSILVKPTVYVYALTSSVLAPIAYQVDEDGLALAGSYDVGADTFSAYDFTRLAPIKLDDAGGGVHAYQTIAQANQAGLVVDSFVTFGQSIDGENEVLADCYVRGQHHLLFNAVLQAFEVRDVTLLTVEINGNAPFFNCTFQNGVTILSGAITDVYSCYLISRPAVAGTLRIWPGNTLAGAFFTGLTDNGNGTYATPEGGTIHDNRNIAPGPGNAQYRHFITTPGGVVTPNYVLI